MNKFYLFMLAIAGSFTFVSCDDNDDSKVGPTPTPKSKTELLTSAGWKIKSFTVTPAVDYNGDGTTETDILQFRPACRKDDVYIYKPNNTISFEAGTAKCDPTEPQVWATGTWAFANNETVLTFTTSGSTTPNTYNIIELTDSTLTYSMNYVSSTDGLPRTAIESFRH